MSAEHSAPVIKTQFLYRSKVLQGIVRHAFITVSKIMSGKKMKAKINPRRFSIPCPRRIRDRGENGLKWLSCYIGGKKNLKHV